MRTLAAAPQFSEYSFAGLTGVDLCCGVEGVMLAGAGFFEGVPRGCGSEAPSLVEKRRISSLTLFSPRLGLGRPVPTASSSVDSGPSGGEVEIAAASAMAGGFGVGGVLKTIQRLADAKLTRIIRSGTARRRLGGVARHT
jgi:hypothetical protein